MKKRTSKFPVRLTLAIAGQQIDLKEIDADEIADAIREYGRQYFSFWLNENGKGDLEVAICDFGFELGSETLDSLFNRELEEMEDSDQEYRDDFLRAITKLRKTLDRVEKKIRNG